MAPTSLARNAQEDKRKSTHSIGTVPRKCPNLQRLIERKLAAEGHEAPHESTEMKVNRIRKGGSILQQIESPDKAKPFLKSHLRD